MEENNKPKEEDLQEDVLQEETLQEGNTETLDGEVTEGAEVEIIDETAEKIAKLEQQAAENFDKYQRCLAEFDNFRKRTAREKAGMYDDGAKDTIEKLLVVVDNLERAVAAEAGKEEEKDAFLKGVEMILKQFQEVLAGLGVEEIKALGQKFDPNLHAAVAHEEDENYGENEVILEMLKGYKYKDKVIRHSMVKVAN